MDRASQYRQTLTDLMRAKYRSERADDPPEVETSLSVDPVDGRCLLLRVGWDRGRRVREVYLHAHVRDGKVWVEEDGTEEGLANELVAAGIPREDIVLAFMPPEKRRLTDFATV